MKTEFLDQKILRLNMGQELSIQIVQDIKQMLKRSRPSEWKVTSPPPKRIKTFHETGAKAPRLDKILSVE